VTDLRGLLYLPSGEIQYKLRYPDEWRNLPVRNALRKKSIPGKLHKNPLKINADKLAPPGTQGLYSYRIPFIL